MTITDGIKIAETKNMLSQIQGFCWGGGGVQQIQLRTEDRENGDPGTVAPYSGVLEAAVILYKKFHFT
jgi:hypothetical protein